MYSSDSDEDDKIDNLWAFNPNPAEEEISEEQKKAELLAIKKSRKVLQTMSDNKPFLSFYINLLLQKAV